MNRMVVALLFIGWMEEDVETMPATSRASSSMVIPKQAGGLSHPERWSGGGCQG